MQPWEKDVKEELEQTYAYLGHPRDSPVQPTTSGGNRCRTADPNPGKHGAPESNCPDSIIRRKIDDWVAE